MDNSFLHQLRQYVAIPSVSTQPKHRNDCVKAAKWMAAKLNSMGINAKLVPTGGHPLVYGRYKSPSRNSPHIVIYGHYDVQPPEPFSLWKTSPFVLTERAGKLFARGVADNKGPTLALLHGLERALRKKKLNITCLIEGEEEVGSRNLPQALRKLKKRIGKVDAIILSDTASLDPEHLQLSTGLRGLLDFELRIRGIARDLHSGNGGPVPNAIRELSRIIGGLYSEDGRVNIPHFYDGAPKPTPLETASMKKALNAKKFAREIGARGYYGFGGKSPFEVSCFMPSFEINGIMGGYQGPGGKTIIPAEASAKITCRLAAGQNPGKFQKTVLDELKKRVDARLFDFEIIVQESAKSAYAAPMADKGFFGKAMKSVDSACRSVTGNGALYLREGGSIPIMSSFRETLGADAIMLGLFTEDSFLHSPNENVSLKLLENGSRVWEEFFTRVG